MSSPWFSTHSHSEWSCLDGMGSVTAMVEKAAAMGQPAIGLTDHGNMSGSFELYRTCREAGLKPYPGIEAYVVDDIADKDAQRHHLTLMAYSTQGYKNLVALSSLSNRRDGHFYYRPRID